MNTVTAPRFDEGWKTCPLIEFYGSLGLYFPPLYEFHVFRAVFI